MIFLVSFRIHDHHSILRKPCFGPYAHGCHNVLNSVSIHIINSQMVDRFFPFFCAVAALPFLYEKILSGQRGNQHSTYASQENTFPVHRTTTSRLSNSYINIVVLQALSGPRPTIVYHLRTTLSMGEAFIREKAKVRGLERVSHGRPHQNRGGVCPSR